MLKFTRAISRLNGWRRWLVAFVAGGLCVFAFAPFFLWPILFFTFPVLVLLIDGAAARFDAGRSTISDKSRWRRVRAAAAIGWWFGFGYFATQLYWIGEAFLVEADKFAWALPFAVTILPAGLALFWAAAAALAAFAWLPGMTRVLALVTALGATEWLRGHVLTGFPWNVPGYALTYPLALMQSAGLIGIYGLTLVALMVFIAPGVIWADTLAASEGRGNNGKPGAGKRAKLATVAIPLIPLVVMAVYGTVQLQTHVGPPVPGVKLRIVQPSVPQNEKWLPEHQRRIFDLHLKLSNQSPDGKPDNLSDITLLIWPEAAMPFRPLREPFALSSIASLLPAGVHLLSGALRVTDANPEVLGSKREIFNTILVLNSEGQLVDHYDKTHLVPFGEYLPFQETLEAIGLEQLDQVRGGFNTGPTPRPSLVIPGLPVIGPLICYEAIFPGVGRKAAIRPALIVNLTNDGWFGNSIGPHQHLHQARVRAVEEGVSLIRAANNGISAIIDPRGRVLQQLGLDRIGVIDSSLPAALALPPPYSRYGDIVFWIMWLLCIMGLGGKLYRFGL